MKEVIPYANLEGSKKEQVSQMFDTISPKYDLLNTVLSMGIDKIWRKTLVSIVKKENPKSILDLATGTADLAIALEKTGAEKIIGADISEGMLAVGKEKVKKAGLENKITLSFGDAENLNYKDESFDVVTAAFGVRNFEDLEKGLKEIHRVLRKGGTVAILEFSQPERFPFRPLYFFYFSKILPLIGRLVSKDVSAYTYLPESVKAFPYGKQFLSIMESCGFLQTKVKSLTFGIASIYTAKK